MSTERSLALVRPPSEGLRRPSPIQCVGVALVLAGFIIHRNATLNHFYLLGSSLDANWFAGMLWRGDWMMPGGPSVDTWSAYAYHLTVSLAIFAVLSQFFQGDGVAWFADLMGAWHAFVNGVFAWAVARAARARGLSPVATAALMVGLGAALLVSPQQASFVATPHYQILIPGLIVAMFAAHAVGARKWAIFWFVFLLGVREDCGLHAATFLVPFALLGRWQTGRWPRFELTLAAIGVAWSLIAFPLGPWLAQYDGGSLNASLRGNPPWAHVTLDRIIYRVDVFAWQVGHVWGPLLTVLLAAWWRRDALLAVGPVATFPWLFLHLIAGNYPPAYLFSYHYLFPFVAALMWPTVVILLRTGPLAWAGSARGLFVVQAVALATSYIPMLNENGPYYGSRWANVHYVLSDDARHADRYQGFMDALVWAQNEVGRLGMEPNMTSFATRDMSRALWYDAVVRPGETPKVVDSIALLDMPWCDKELLQLIKDADLPHEYWVLGTRIVLLSRRSLAELPSFAPLIKEMPRRSGEFCGRWQPLRDSPHPPVAGRWPTIERR